MQRSTSTSEYGAFFHFLEHFDYFVVYVDWKCRISCRKGTNSMVGYRFGGGGGVKRRQNSDGVFTRTTFIRSSV